MHIATAQCAAARTKAINTWIDFLSANPILFPCISTNDEFLSFLVDPTTYPNAISLAQNNIDVDVMG